MNTESLDLKQCNIYRLKIQTHVNLKVQVYKNGQGFAINI